MLILAAVFVFAVPKLLGVPLRSQSTIRNRTTKRGLGTEPGAARSSRAQKPSSPIEELRRASTRLIVALLMLAAGTALLVFLIVRWILQALERILS